jgi:hypothetical protein
MDILSTEERIVNWQCSCSHVSCAVRCAGWSQRIAAAQRERVASRNFQSQLLQRDTTRLIKDVSCSGARTEYRGQSARLNTFTIRLPVATHCNETQQQRVGLTTEFCMRTYSYFLQDLHLSRPKLHLGA